MTVSRHSRSLAAALSVGVLGAPAALAHHSFVMFDVTQQPQIAGTVRAFTFEYPHSWLWLTVADGHGGTQTWAFENASPAQLNRIGGWTRTSLKPGDQVTVRYYPLRSKQHGGRFTSVTLPDGKVLPGLLVRGGPGPSPGGGAPPAGGRPPA